MTIAAVGDVHIGNISASGGRRVGSINRRCRWSLDALARAVEVANTNASPFVILGDLFDVSRPESAVIFHVQQVLRKAKHGVHIIPGNHDMNSAEMFDNACSPLAPVATVYEVPTIASLSDDIDGLMIPFRPGLATEWLPEIVDEMGPHIGHMKPIVMCIHLGISDGKTPYYLDGHDDTIPASMLQEMCAKWKIDHVLAGNWHWYQRWALHGGGKMVQVGTLAPARHGDGGFEGRGLVTMLQGDGALGTIEVEGPRFLTVDSLDGLDEAFGREGSPLFIKAKLPADQHVEAYSRYHERFSDDDPNAAPELEVVEVSTTKVLDETELGAQIERLSELPVEAAVHETIVEVATELELDADRLSATVTELWKRGADGSRP